MPAILVGILISVCSTRYFSEERTSHFIVPILRWLFPSAAPWTLHRVHGAIRKMAHLFEYAVFSVLVFRGVRGGRQGWRLSWTLPTVAVVAAYAALDEWHQSFVPLRHASPRGVAIDIVGGLLAQVAVWWYATRSGFGKGQN